MIDWKFEKGDRVKRAIDCYADVWVMKYGNVVARYGVYGIYYGDNGPFNDREVYMVEWDDGSVSRGILPHGMNRIDFVWPDHMKDKVVDSYLMRR